MRARKTQHPYVYRVIYPQDGIDGYLAKVIRQTGKLQKVFQLSAFKGVHRKCLKAAVNAATAFAKKHPRLTRRELAELSRPRKDSDLPVGVRRVFKEVKGRFYHVYEASWSPVPHLQKKQRFSVNLYGEAEALALAIKARRRGVRAMQS